MATDLNFWLMKNSNVLEIAIVKPRIYCNDGFNLSVQASEYAYSTPRRAYGPWTHVEMGYPSGDPGEEFLEFAEDDSRTVYPYVPIERIEALIDRHGGIHEKASSRAGDGIL